MVAALLSADYVRHYNDDEGVMDSVCGRCCRTVAQSRSEQTLTLLEHVHLCAPLPTCDDQLGFNGGLVFAGD